MTAHLRVLFKNSQIASNKILIQEVEVWSQVILTEGGVRKQREEPGNLAFKRLNSRADASRCHLRSKSRNNKS